MQETECIADPSNGTNGKATEPSESGQLGGIQAAMAARRQKISNSKSYGYEQETTSESRAQLFECGSVQSQIDHLEEAECRALAEASAQTQRCLMHEQSFKSEQELCTSLRNEVAVAISARDQAHSIAEGAAGQMDQLKHRCLQLQELVRSLEAELVRNQRSEEQLTAELREREVSKSECSKSQDTELLDSEPQPEPHVDSTGSDSARLCVPALQLRKVSSSSSDAHSKNHLVPPGIEDSLEEAMTPAMSERLLQDECDELRRAVSEAALAEKREQDTAQKHQDQVRRLQRNVQKLQQQVRRPRHAFHEAALAAAAESKKQGGVQRMKRLQDLGETSSSFLFI